MRTTKFILVSAIIAAGIVSQPGRLRAQAAAGPIHPAKASGDSSAPPPAAEPPKAPDVPQKRDLTGSWKLNEEQSDDASEKLKQAQQAGAGNRGGGGNRGVWGGGGGYPGGGYPGGGGGGGYGGRRGMGGESDADFQKIQEAINPANALAFKQNDAEIDMSDDQGRRRVYYTDGRKIEKPKKDKDKDKDKTNDTKELAARWEGMKLVSDEKGPHGKITRLFEVPAGGQQLRETVHFEDARGNPVTVRYVYDIVKPEKKDGTSSTTITSN